MSIAPAAARQRAQSENRPEEALKQSAHENGQGNSLFPSRRLSKEIPEGSQCFPAFNVIAIQM
jgi:hypothetical protein